ncbi:ORF1 [torque teno Delphinidae virus 45]
MPYGLYRRRGYGRRRSRGLWYRRRWWARRHRYWSWRHRRPRYRWVRGTRQSFLSYKRRKNRRRWLRIKRLRKWRRKIMYKGPFPIINFAPPVTRRCKIYGYMPLMYFTGKQISWPFIDPITHAHLGGGIAFNDITLNKLYLENLRFHNKWTQSNYGFEYGKFLGGSITLYRHEHISYINKYFQGSAIYDGQTYMDIHPGVLMLDRHSIKMAANHRIPFRKRYKKKKIKIKRPKNLTNEWYKLCELGEKILIRLGTSVCDFEHPFQTVNDDTGNFYVSIGYHTPDRRSLTTYDGTSVQSGTRTVYNATTMVKWAVDWVTWGGPINVVVPYLKTVAYCDGKFGELIVDSSGAPFHHYPQDCKDPVWGSKNKYKPAYQLTTSIYEKEKYENKTMVEICQQKTRKPQTIIYNDLQFKSFTAGLPLVTPQAKPECSWSSHRSNIPNTPYQCKSWNRDSSNNQGFWPGRYSAYYDRGLGNCVYGLYLTQERGAQSTYKKFADGTTGPGVSSQSNFLHVKFFMDIPYWLVFYGHNYKTFLAYLNGLRKDIVRQSYAHQGFFAVAIRAFPAEPVRSGAFFQGYAPLRYMGSNREYFTDRTSYKYWATGTNQPPVNELGDIDYNSWIFCILRDGRSVCYGSSMEASLLNYGYWGNYFFTPGTWTCPDDILTLGRSGPFIHNWADPRFNKEAVNLFARYSFYFKWGGYQYPEKPRPRDLREQCKAPENPPGEHFSRRRRHIIMPSGEPIHPAEVSAGALWAPRDLSDTGLIRSPAWGRLTDPSIPPAEHLGLRPSGSGIDSALFSAYSAHRKRDSVSPPSTEEEEDTEDQQSLWPLPALSRYRKEIPQAPQILVPGRRKRSASPSTEPDCIPCRRGRDPQSHGRPRELSHRFGVLQSRQRLLQRLIREQEALRHGGYLSD